VHTIIIVDPERYSAYGDRTTRPMRYGHGVQPPTLAVSVCFTTV